MSNRSTKASLAIKKLIDEAKVALSHQEIQNELGGLCNRVTIYRVLDRLIYRGEIHRVMDIDGITRYASCTTSCTNNHHQHDHVHFSCTACKKVSCLENVVPNLKLPPSYRIEEVNFTVSGLCPECITKN